MYNSPELKNMLSWLHRTSLCSGDHTLFDEGILQDFQWFFGSITPASAAGDHTLFDESICSSELHACRVLCMPDYKYMLIVNVISIAGHIY